MQKSVFFIRNTLINLIKFVPISPTSIILPPSAMIPYLIPSSRLLTMPPGEKIYLGEKLGGLEDQQR